MVKNLPAVQETAVQFLGEEDTLEKGPATHPSLLACRIPWTVYRPWGCKDSDTTERLSLSIWFFIVAVPIYTRTSNVVGFLFLHILSSIYYL